MALDYLPPRYMWIVTFEDGQALPQFDPETGKQNKFPFHAQDKITKIGWFPLSAHMVEKIREGEGIEALSLELPTYEITLQKDQLPYMRYTTRIPPGQFHKCLECGAQWIFSFGKPDPSVEKQGYPWHSDHKFIAMPTGPPTRVAVCPSCRFHNLPTDKPEERRIVRMATDMRYLIYKLGVQDPQGGLQYFEIDQWGKVLNEVP